MKKIKILAILAIVCGLLIGSIHIESIAAGGPIRLRNQKPGMTYAYGIYFPDTGYICTTVSLGNRTTIAKYVLPKNLNKISFSKLKKSFPGVAAMSVGFYGGGKEKPANYKKYWDDIQINQNNSWSVETRADRLAQKVSDRDYHCNKTKFNILYQEARDGFDMI